MERELNMAGKKSRRAWYFYDFGNSAYASVILLAVYPTFFKNVVVGGVEGTRFWGTSVGIAAILVAVSSPVLGAIADFTKSKKRFLLFFTSISIVSTAMLFFVGEGDVFAGMLFFIIAEIGYRMAQVFYDALLTDVATPETIGFVSGKGWAVGMLGGIIALVFVLVPIQFIGNSAVRYSFLITAGFYLLSSIPTFVWVREKQGPSRSGSGIVGPAFRKLATTFRHAKRYKEFIKYMIAYLIYNDGIMMLMDFAAIIGATLFGMKQTQLILFVILIQASGAAGALFFGRITDKRSGKEAIILSLLILIVSVSGLFFIDKLVWFYVVGFFAGFSLSGAQAVSRTVVSQLAPETETAEFYGFLSVAGRTSTFIGPLVFGTISFRAHNWYVNHGYGAVQAEHYGLHWSVGSIIAFLALGLLILLFIKRVTYKKAD